MPICSAEHDDFEDDDAEETVDQGPSSADIDALDHESALCPECGAEIWDAAEICPKCYAYVGGETVVRKPWPRWMRVAVTLTVAAGLIIITMLCFMSPAINEGRWP